MILEHFRSRFRFRPLAPAVRSASSYRRSPPRVFGWTKAQILDELMYTNTKFSLAACSLSIPFFGFLFYQCGNPDLLPLINLLTDLLLPLQIPVRPQTAEGGEGPQGKGRTSRGRTRISFPPLVFLKYHLIIPTREKKNLTPCRASFST